MTDINIYNRDEKILTSKIINEIGKVISKNNTKNITFIIQGEFYLNLNIRIIKALYYEVKAFIDNDNFIMKMLKKQQSK
ncbi:hypothetical protein [Clostridium butyricum]